jgi:hypothetical protein
VRNLATAALLFFIACNTASDLRQWYAVTEPTARTSRNESDVAVLETAPSDRPFTVIGIFAPPANAFESYAEALNGARQVAAAYGAQAVVITKSDEVSLTRRNVFEPATGIIFRAQAVVWK